MTDIDSSVDCFLFRELMMNSLPTLFRPQRVVSFLKCLIGSGSFEFNTLLDFCLRFFCNPFSSIYASVFRGFTPPQQMCFVKSRQKIAIFFLVLQSFPKFQNGKQYSCDKTKPGLLDQQVTKRQYIKHAYKLTKCQQKKTMSQNSAQRASNFDVHVPFSASC